MFDYPKIKNNIIPLLFSISIFFSYQKLYIFELRFIYLSLILFIFFDKKFNKKFFFTIFKVSLITFFVLLTHLLLNDVINFNQTSFDNKIFLKTIIQILVISLTIIIIYHYNNYLIKHIRKIFDFFTIIFCTLLFIHNLKYEGILFDTLFKCDLGFFYNTRFLFLENSHFSIIAIPVILNFIYNIKYYLKYKILLIFYIFFTIFAFGNFSLTFYLTSLFSLLLILLFYKNLEKYKIILLLFFFISSNIFFFYGNQIYKFLNFNNIDVCVSKALEIKKKHKLKINQEIFQGEVLEPKRKLLDNFSKNEISNLSMAIQIYSLYVAKESMIKNSFGYGMSNYKMFRGKIDKSMKKEYISINENELKYFDGLNSELLREKIIFKESYMPNIPSTVLNYNLNSGSNNFSKIIVEFGVFGLIFSIFCLAAVFIPGISIELKFTLFPLLYSQLFIRGTGYFNSGFLIVSIILLTLIINIITKNEK